jgi:hypothetical protein
VEQHVYLCSVVSATSSLIQQSTGRHVAPLYHTILTDPTTRSLKTQSSFSDLVVGSESVYCGRVKQHVYLYSVVSVS